MYDYYTYIYFQELLQTLGLEEGATFDDVKVAYRSLAKEWHPDLFALNPERRAEGEEKMKQINTAYRWLAANRKVFTVDWKKILWQQEKQNRAYQRSSRIQKAPVMPKGLVWLLIGIMVFIVVRTLAAGSPENGDIYVLAFAVFSLTILSLTHKPSARKHK